MPATVTRTEKHPPRLDRSAAVDRQVHSRLRNCPYSYFFNRITWKYDGTRLTIRGCVPTFYMKQMLQTVLRNIDGVESLVNQVDVISATGLSAVQKR